jgi:DNA-binding CsgD family transcriptional regulator/tetratricopeptide (TPR) repeat protein
MTSLTSLSSRTGRGLAVKGAVGKSGRWPLTGRDGELAEALAAVVDRSVQGVVFSGAAGAGKTRLAEECLASVAERGFVVAQATASAAAGSVPLGAVAHLLPAGVDLSDPVAGFAAVAASLRRAGGRRVVLLDDLHLLDGTSAVLLRQLMDAGVLRLLATVRTGEPLGDAVHALVYGKAVRRIGTAEFDLATTDEVVRAALGAPLSRRAVFALFRASGGNALYLRELVLAAVDSGALRMVGEVWELVGELSASRRLAEVVHARLEHLGEHERAVLDRIAVCGSQSVAELCRLGPAGTVDRLAGAGLVEIGAERRRTSVRLAHPLYGEVLRGTLPTVRRRALLAAEADRIVERGARRRGDALRIASHRLSATGTADPALLWQAAGLARHSHDYPQVVTLLQALPAQEVTVGTRVLLGDAYFQMGRGEDAERTLAEAAPLARGDEEVLGVVMTRVDNLLWSKADLSAALAANTEALRRVTTEAASHLLRINEGYLYVAKGRFTEGLSRLEVLEEDIEEVQGDINPWLRGALMKALGLSLVTRTQQAARWALRAYDAHMAVDEEALVSHPAVQKLPWVLALCEGGQLAAATREAEATYYQLAAFSSVVRVWLLVLGARAQWLAGHLSTARRWYAEAIALGRKVDNTMVLRAGLNGLAACAAVQGDVEAATEAVVELRGLPDALGFLSEGELQLGPAWLAAAQGDQALARDLLREGAASARRTGHLTGESLLLTDIARLGAPGEVAERLHELAAQGDGGTLLPARAAFAAALACGDPRQLHDAALQLEGTGSDLIAAEAFAATAHALRRTGLPRAAADAGNRSAAALERCQGARTPLLATSAAPVPLTEREREIAVAAAVGTPSRTIATSLTLSVRTVNNHLQRVYAKLGVTSRRELADALGLNRNL